MMALKRLVICSGDNEVLFDGASQTAEPSTSGTFSSAAEVVQASDECLTLPAPALPVEAGEPGSSDYDDDPPTLALNAIFSAREAPTR